MTDDLDDDWLSGPDIDEPDATEEPKQAGPRAEMTSNGLRILDPDTLDKIGGYSVSNSLISNVLQCPAKAIADKYVIADVLPVEPLGPMVLGSAFHKVMELFFRIPEGQRTAKALVASYNKMLNDTEEGDPISTSKEAQQWVRTAIKHFWNMAGLDIQNDHVAMVTLRNRKGEEYQKIGLELFVKGQLDGMKRPTLGFIDRLLQNPDGKYVIDDWKTGEKMKTYNPDDRFPKFDYARQQVLYALLLERDGKDVETARLIYPRVHNPDGTYGAIDVIPVDDPLYRRRAIRDAQTTERILDSGFQQNLFQYDPSGLCSWCPLVNVCPAARRIKSGEEARRQAPTVKEYEGVLQCEDHSMDN